MKKQGMPENKSTQENTPSSADSAGESSCAPPPKLMVPMARQQSHRSISRLIAESMGRPGSPMTPSPAGSAEVRSILERLEHVEMESRELLSKLFSLLQTDARLETYIRRRLQDPSVSAMWELVEQLLVPSDNPLDVPNMWSQDDSNTRGVKHSSDDGDAFANERFKVRMFDMDEVPVLAHPLQAAANADGDSSRGDSPSKMI